jgi:site-specific DNA-methyltransferase (adenine-specific)
MSYQRKELIGDATLYLGDCLERMKEIPDGSVDAIITDPPYGTMKGAQLDGWGGVKTQWDTTIEIGEMLEQCNRVLRTNGALILFSQEPYTSELITEAHGNLPFSYRMVWLKDHFANCLVVNKAPVNYTEDVCVFFKKYDTLSQHPLREYASQVFRHIGKTKKELFNEMGHQGVCHFMRENSTQFGLCTEKTYNEIIALYSIDKQSWFKSFADMEEINRRFARRFARRFNLPTGKKYKSNVLQYRKDYGGLHPTQKPVALMEDLMRTYTNEGEAVLDFAMGSGTTGVACVNTGRKFIGIEMDEGYFDVACKRIENAYRQEHLFGELA